MKLFPHLLFVVLSGALSAPPHALRDSVHPDPSLVDAVRAAYQRDFRERFDRPAIYKNPQAQNCRGETPEYAPMIAPPILFGWEDVDGDGVPEIRSPAPYGRGR